MSEILGSIVRKIEKVAGITYGEFSVDFQSGSQNPFGEFGMPETIFDIQPYGGPWRNVPQPASQSSGWARLQVKFAQDSEPLLLRPEQTAQLLAQRPHQEVCLLLGDGKINIPVDAISQAPHLLRQMEYAYLVKKFQSGTLRLILR